MCECVRVFILYSGRTLQRNHHSWKTRVGPGCRLREPITPKLDASGKNSAEHKRPAADQQTLLDPHIRWLHWHGVHKKRARKRHDGKPRNQKPVITAHERCGSQRQSKTTELREPKPRLGTEAATNDTKGTMAPKPATMSICLSPKTSTTFQEIRHHVLSSPEQLARKNGPEQ